MKCHQQNIIYFPFLSSRENKDSLAGSAFNSFLVSIKTLSLQGGEKNWHSGRRRPSQVSVSPWKSRRDAPSISLLLILLQLHEVQTLWRAAGVPLLTMTRPKNSLPLEVRLCARQALIRALMELKVKRIQGEVPTYVFFGKLLPPASHGPLSTKF